MQHDGGPFALARTEVVASWPKGSFAENLAIADDGSIFVTLHTDRAVVRVDAASGVVSGFAQFPTPVAGLAFAADGSLIVSGGTPGERPGVIWRVLPDGAVQHIADVPESMFLNGVTPLPGGNRFLVADSFGGLVYVVDPSGGDVQTWLADRRLAPSDTSGMPGANGIKLFGGDAYISVTQSDTILRTTLRNGAAGPLEVFAERLRADDFAIGLDGSLYIATHVAESLVRLDPDGQRTTLAGTAQGMMGSTAVAFGRTWADKTALYVTTTGGTMTVSADRQEAAKLVRVHIGSGGQPLLD